MHVITTTQEAEVERIMILDQAKQNVSETPFQSIIQVEVCSRGPSYMGGHREADRGPGQPQTKMWDP
jgi:hypothetical protein